MRILLMNADYGFFLKWFYGRNPDLCHASYALQMAARNETLFGTADFYSRNFAAAGHIAADIHVNNSWLQSAWAREHGLSEVTQSLDSGANSAQLNRLKLTLNKYRHLIGPVARALGLTAKLGAQARAILLAQVEEFRPDVIINQDIFFVDAPLIRAMRRKNRTIIAYCGISPPKGFPFSNYDLSLSMLNWVVDLIRSQGHNAEQSHLAFEPDILRQLNPASTTKDIPVSFVGSLSSDHAGRIAFLEELSRKCSLELWIPNVDALSPQSPLHKCNRGAAFGRDAYEIMRRSQITLNSHVGAGRGQAANMRHFEATGVASLLLTDNKGNLEDLFAPGREVDTYDASEDAIAKIKFYLDHPDHLNAVALAGRRRTLEAHTYRHRTDQILSYIERYAS